MRLNKIDYKFVRGKKVNWDVTTIININPIIECSIKTLF